VIQYIVFRRRNVSEIGHFFMDGVVEVKALDSMGVSSALSAPTRGWAVTPSAAPRIMLSPDIVQKSFKWRPLKRDCSLSSAVRSAEHH